MIEKLKNEISKLESRVSGIEEELNNFESESEEALSEGKKFDFSKVTNLKNELSTLIKVIDKKTEELKELTEEKTKKDKIALIEKQKAEIEAFSKKTNKKIAEGFNLIIEALSEKMPDITALTKGASGGFYQNNYFNNLKEKATGQKLFTEILKSIFPRLEKANKEILLGDFNSISKERLEDIAEKFI